ncbi:hypothetical protein DRN75_04110 [Nanoarchaeota archaeon]|nr:MAG: hypothetical protein DRN75_04110 [Nanoarchaeota archaeon]
MSGDMWAGLPSLAVRRHAKEGLKFFALPPAVLLFFLPLPIAPAPAPAPITITTTARRRRAEEILKNLFVEGQRYLNP